VTLVGLVLVFVIGIMIMKTQDRVEKKLVSLVEEAQENQAALLVSVDTSFEDELDEIHDECRPPYYDVTENGRRVVLQRGEPEYEELWRHLQGKGKHV